MDVSNTAVVADVTTWIAAIGGVVVALKVLVVALLAVAAITPTEKDDNVLNRINNLLGLLTGVFKR